MPHAETQMETAQPVVVPTASLHGKVALITGGSRGIGAGCALELARRGACVAVNYAHSREAADAVVASILALPINKAALTTPSTVTSKAGTTKASDSHSNSTTPETSNGTICETVDGSSTGEINEPTNEPINGSTSDPLNDIANGNTNGTIKGTTNDTTNGTTNDTSTPTTPPTQLARAIALQADVSRVPEIASLFTRTIAHFGRLDIIMSNSGTESWDKTSEITEEKFDHVFGLNARAQFFVGQAALKYLEPNGRLVLMSSIAAGLLGVKDHALYNASKMAVIGMVKAFATDFGGEGDYGQWCGAGGD